MPNKELLQVFIGVVDAKLFKTNETKYNKFFELNMELLMEKVYRTCWW